MSQWLQSGLRRDLCVLIASLEDPTDQECKAALESHYEKRLSQRRVFDALDALVDSGHARAIADGLHDRYELTDAGRAALDAHYEWLTEHVAAND